MHISFSELSLFNIHKNEDSINFIKLAVTSSLSCLTSQEVLRMFFIFKLSIYNSTTKKTLFYRFHPKKYPKYRSFANFTRPSKVQIIQMTRFVC